MNRSDDVQHKGQNNKDKRKNRSQLSELGIPGLGLSLGQEIISAAGNRAGQARAFTALHQNDHGDGKAGEKLEDGKNDLKSRHVFQSFRNNHFSQLTGVYHRAIDNSRVFSLKSIQKKE